MKNIIALSLLYLFTVQNARGQDPLRFAEEIRSFDKIASTDLRAGAVFTGSSSMRLWEDIQSDCASYQPINTGFGGSHMSDLLFYIQETILRFNPREVFIYEGDNDINAGKSPDEILRTAQEITNKILATIPDARIHFISAKPSASRWHHRQQYVAFNVLLKKYCDNQPQLDFIDVWHPMLNASGYPKPELFISDSLHMNKKGYAIWKNAICSAGSSVLTSDIEGITATLMDYIEGSTNGQPDRLKKAFHSDLNLYYIRDGALKTWSGTDYIADTKEGVSTGESGKIISIDYENDIAVAKVQISHPKSSTPYIDYFMLTKINGHWTIVHKMFTKRVNK